MISLQSILFLHRRRHGRLFVDGMAHDGNSQAARAHRVLLRIDNLLSAPHTVAHQPRRHISVGLRLYSARYSALECARRRIPPYRPRLACLGNSASVQLPPRFNRLVDVLGSAKICAFGHRIDSALDRAHRVAAAGQMDTTSPILRKHWSFILVATSAQLFAHVLAASAATLRSCAQQLASDCGRLSTLPQLGAINRQRSVRLECIVAFPTIHQTSASSPQKLRS